MSVNSIPNSFNFLTSASTNGVFGGSGYSSGLIFIGSSATLFVNLDCTLECIIEIYEASADNEDNKVLFFSKTLPANSKYSKKFAITQAFAEIFIRNNNQNNPPDNGILYLETSTSTNVQYSTQTFLNSQIEIDDNAGLIRLSNNYEVDLVRGIQKDFQKINIQGLQETNPPTVTTIGFSQADYKMLNEYSQFEIFVVSPNDVVGGIGARKVRIQGVLFGGEEFDTEYDLVLGLTQYPVGVIAVHRMTIIEVGSSKFNNGIISCGSVSGTEFGEITPFTNVSHCAYFSVPNNKQLIVRDIDISCYSGGGKIQIWEYDPVSGIQATIGTFLVNTTYNTFKYTLDGLITAGKSIKVNYTAGSTIGDILINVNINAVLCPSISSF
jgi:hypothetical protein